MKKLIEERTYKIKENVVLVLELYYENHQAIMSSRIEKRQGCWRMYGEFGYGYRLVLMRDIKRYSNKVALDAGVKFDNLIETFLIETLKEGGFTEEANQVKDFINFNYDIKTIRGLKR